MNRKEAARWVEAWDYCKKTSAVPIVLAQAAARKYRTAARILLDQKPPIAIRKGMKPGRVGYRAVKVKTPQAIKKDLRKELEALCKAIVFTRDCGRPEAREGVCITCRNYRVLQWGHFIRQQDSKWLQYDPRNTGGQCAGCNGPAGRGRPLDYAIAIDNRDGIGSAKALQDEARRMDAFWRPNKTTLGEQLAKLQKHPLAPRIEAATPPGEGPPRTGTNNVTRK